MAEQQAMVSQTIHTKTIGLRAEQNGPNSTVMVSSHKQYVANLITDLHQKVNCFEAGRISQCIDEWRKITSDPEILDVVSGYTIELMEGPPPHINQSNYELTSFDEKIVDLEISKLVAKKVIVPSCHERGEVISPIFVCPKKDGSHRMILNLKRLNTYVEYHHFKMDTLWSVIKLITPNCFMACIDLKDAYYCVPVSPSSQKLLKFMWKGQLYQYTCLPNGLSSCPRKFTKLLKPVYTVLRKKGHVSSGYIDDAYLQGNTYGDCACNVVDTVDLFSTLGLVVHPDKSVFEPTQSLEFLGFLLNSILMRITLTSQKVEKIQSACASLLNKSSRVSIRNVSRVIGLLVSSFPGVMFGPLYYRALERDKVQALKSSRGHFDSYMSLSQNAIEELQWWIASLPTAYNEINHGTPDIVINTDASLTGWGGVLNERTCGGHWSLAEQTFHINYLELLAVLYVLQSFQASLVNKHVMALIDNTTAVSCITHMGTSHSDLCNSITKTIWEWCIANHIWLSAAHIPGIENTGADTESRKLRDETEWMLDSSVFNNVLKTLHLTPDVDLFASRLNHQVVKYISYQPDPQAIAVDAFLINWKDYDVFYAFPPFSLITQVLQKIQNQCATGLLIVPDWPTQTWYPKLMRMLVNYPVLIPPGEKLLHLPYKPTKVHPLHKTMWLLACHLSGDVLKTKEFQSQLPSISSSHGEPLHKSSTAPTSNNGRFSVIPEGFIQFHLLSNMP